MTNTTITRIPATVTADPKAFGEALPAKWIVDPWVTDLNTKILFG